MTGAEREGPRAGFFRLPLTQSGRWAVGLFVASAVVFGAFVYLLGSVQGSTGGVGWRGIAVQVTGTMILLVGLAASAVAAFSLVKKGERSWAVLLALTPLTLLVLAMAWEILTAVLGLGD